MIGSPLWWGVQVAVNFLDFFMVYMVTHFMRKRKFNVKQLHVLMCMVYSLTLALVFYYLGSYIFRVIVYISMLLVIFMVTERRSLVDLVVAYIICSAMVLIVQNPIATILWLINTQVQIIFPINFLIVQFITTLIMILLCRKLNINSWFNIIQKNIVLKLISIAIILISDIILFILNFEYDLLFLLSSSVFIIIFVISIFTILKKFYYNLQSGFIANKLTNSLFSLETTILDKENVDNTEFIKAELQRISLGMGLDINIRSTYDYKLQQDKNFHHLNITLTYIMEFIYYKVISSKKRIFISRFLDYDEEYENIGSYYTMLWLGTLMDHAIETTYSKPICITIKSTSNEYCLGVDAEHIGSDNGEDIRKLLDGNYSKFNKHRGEAFYTLNEQVKERGGIVKLEEKYEDELNYNCLKVAIVFKKS